MNPVSFIALLPAVEILLLIAMGAFFGFWFTFFWILGTGVLGVVLMRSAKHNLRAVNRRDQHPAADPIGMLSTMVGAVLLILPGPLTDVIGLILVLPWLRNLAFGLWIAKNVHRVVSRNKAYGRIYEGEVVDSSPVNRSGHRVIEIAEEDLDKK